jgi:tRNA(Ile)-lysidine synthase
VGQGSLLRPLLSVPRAELQAYARLHDLPWVEDPSNADLALDRNYLRARIMPLLRERWPAIGVAFEELIDQRRSVDEMLLGGLDPASGMIAIDDLRSGPEAVSAERLRVWLLARRAVAPSGRALQSFVAQLAAPADRQPALALNTGTLRRYRESVYHVLEQPALQTSYAVAVPGSVTLPHGELRVSRCEEGGFSASGEVRAVFRRDRVDVDERLLVRGHRRGVNKLLQEAAVPPWERECYPLLIDDMGLAAIPDVACRDAGASMCPEKKLWQANWRALVR